MKIKTKKQEILDELNKYRSELARLKAPKLDYRTDTSEIARLEDKVKELKVKLNEISL